MNTETMPVGSAEGLGGVDPTEVDDLDFEPEGDFLPDDIGPPPDIVVFDIGEVLIDETRVWGIWADILGVSRFTFAAVLGAAISQGLDHQAVFPVVAPNSDWVQFEEEHERRYGGFCEEDLYPDVRLCLEELQSMEVVVTIAGNQPQRRREQLYALGLPCDHLATSEDFGAEKPEKGFWDALMLLCGASTPEQVLYVGDRVDNDILPAADYGMRTCWLRRGPWGRLQELPDDFQPDLQLDGLGELPLLLAGWRAQD